jgi:hypothetical protein
MGIATDSLKCQCQKTKSKEFTAARLAQDPKDAILFRVPK